MVAARSLGFLIVAALLLSGCTGSKPPATTSSCADLIAHANGTNTQHTTVLFNTSKGDFKAELFDEKSPITVGNFKKLVGDGFYSELLFHRIIKGFVIQTGGMKTDGKFKESPYGNIKNEAKTSGCLNKKFTLSMARGTDADTASNQFFVNTVDNVGLDPGDPPAHFSPDGYAVFGIVYWGQEVVTAIENTPTTAYNAPGANPHCQEDQSDSCPKTDIVLHSITKS